uniref:Serine/threonine protein kinase n=1 Tax=Echinostoma caproni TaxID=27848 RepID=A0A183AG23_9TREM
LAMSINPALKLKLDELFLRWLTDPATQNVLHENLIQLKANESLQTMLAVPSGVVVGPMSSSVYSFFYGSIPCESPAPNFDASAGGVSSVGATSYEDVQSAFTPASCTVG